MRIKLPVPKLGDILPLPLGGYGRVTHIFVGWGAVEGNMLEVDVEPLGAAARNALRAEDTLHCGGGPEDFRGEDFPIPEEALRLLYAAANPPTIRFRGKRRGQHQGAVGQDIVEPIEVADRAELVARLTVRPDDRTVTRVTLLIDRPTDGFDYGWERYAVLGDSGCVGYTDKPL